MPLPWVIKLLRQWTLRNRNLPQESHSEKEGLSPGASQRGSLRFCMLLTVYMADLADLTGMCQWWVGSHLDQDCLVIQKSCPLLNPKPDVRTSKWGFFICSSFQWSHTEIFTVTCLSNWLIDDSWMTMPILGLPEPSCCNPATPRNMSTCRTQHENFYLK